MHTARPFQYKMEQDIYAAWQDGAKVVMPVLPTGGGKTKVIGDIHREYDGWSASIAHRKELIGQISTSLAREGVYHDLLTNDARSPLRRALQDMHIEEVGRNYISDRAKCFVGGVDTIINMGDDPRLKKITLASEDEGHHVLKHNKWGKVFGMFHPEAYGLFPTATPRRADGMGLGRHADGLVDVLIEGPAMRQLINMGYLTDYQLACPKVSDLDMSSISISAATGDYNRDELRKAIRKSTKIVGDVVRHYLQLAKGKKGVVFAVDVEEAVKIAKAFREAGVRAEQVNGTMNGGLRDDLMRKFKRGELDILVNVDLFGEGFDLPAIEVVIMARPTKSFSLFCQQFGRALRLMIPETAKAAWDSYSDSTRRQIIRESIKPYALIIDHVGNMVEHNYPDKPQSWTLDRRDKRAKGLIDDAIPIRSCLSCLKTFERTFISCPHCGEPIPEPAQRGAPEFVDGDLVLLTEEALAKLRGDAEYIDNPPPPPRNLDKGLRDGIVLKQHAIQDQQRKLRDTIAQWAGYYSEVSDRENHKRFYLTFGLTVPEAKGLGIKDAETLQQKILLTISLLSVNMQSH